MPRTYKSEYHRQRSVDKAEQILRGALPEFLKHGYASTSMDKVAYSAGVSKQTLYSYFSDKDGLFTALVKHMACEKFQLVWSKPLKGKPERVLRDLAHRLLKEVNDSEYLCFVRLIVAESGKRPDLAQLFLSNVAVPAIKTLTRYLKEHRELNIVDSEATARIFVGSLIHFIMTQEILHGREIMPIAQERLIDSLVHLIVD
ncbi:MAG: TetR/AcrR family transcriptional regulator [Xenococcaceae cyanobacterium]